LGEAGKTVKMLNVISRLREAVRNLRRKPLALHKTTANAWLEYNYGWRPLVSDIYAAADESLRLVLNKIQRFSGSCTVKEEVIAPQLHNLITSVPGLNTQFTYSPKCELKTGVTIVIS
jgi:hypothetical protein